MSEISNKNIIEIGKNIISIEIDALKKLEQSVDENFIRAVEMINSCKGKVIVTGTGKSGLIGRKISATMSCCNIPSIYLNAYECENGDLGVVRENDLLITISNSGETGVLKHLVVPSCKTLGCKVIALTGNLQSWLAKESDIAIYIGVEKEACYLNINASASTTTTLAMGDALALTAMELRGTTREKTYFLHQGGAWGKALKEEFNK
ncbi:SIS domain-containing protein [Alkalibaculum sp. M08DMB]|uniref:SIS domain-containing protein n=1 Tax=Alkalibaculum sporogenes TaxID=2655001 RepID=A0A6A7K7L2_9FIRM|nr:SIS domain-containing protein [Alkalibaculum sporogenes]